MQRPHARRMPEPVRVWLLGGFRASVGTNAIDDGQWRLRKAAALVKLLSLAPDHRLHREHVMDLLWPDLGKKAASNNLRQTLHAARRALASDPSVGSRYLANKDESLVLCPEERLWVDVDAFEEAAASAYRAREPAACRVAIELYAGELLPEDRYEEWVETRRQELRRMFLSLLLELARLYEERGAYGAGIETLQSTLSEEPANEEVHAWLMRLYALSGRQQEALSQYKRLQEVLSRHFGTEPGPTTRALRDEIAAATFPRTQPAAATVEDPVEAGTHNLPSPRTKFVGREREMVEVKRMLAMTSLLTLIGPGGSGKTRLAMEVARGLVGSFPDGVWIVELAPLSEGALVPQAVAATLGVREQPGSSTIHTLLDALRDKGTLIIMDNCEHLIDAAAALTKALIASCPRLQVLATSREALDVEGAALWQVGPLSVPREQERLTVEEVQGYESAQLFVERALFVERNLYGSSGFALSADNTSAVAEVCRRLDGIPLAIELAAAWVGTLTVEQISERLKASLGLLKGGRTLTRRQQTLRGAMDWSYDLLSEPEQMLFGRLSVFAGGWTLEAAEAVGSGNSLEEEKVLEQLWGLVNKSLVVAEVRTQRAGARYRMLEPIRQYAREKLRESADVDEVQIRHAAFFLALAEEAGTELVGPQQGLWVERLEGEHDNLREALSWVLERGEVELGLRFAAALWRFWFARNYLSEGRNWMERVLTGGVPVASPIRVKALEGLGWLTQFQGDYKRAKATYEEMLELSGQLSDRVNSATALNSLGTLAAYQGDNERARALLEENLQVLMQLEEEENDATTLKRYHALNLLGFLAINEEHDYDRGMALWEESLALAQEAGDAYRVGVSLTSVGYAALLQGNYEQATTRCEETLMFARDLGSAGVELLPENLINLGLAALGQGEHERAARSFKEALVVNQEAGRKPSVINALEGMATLDGALEEATRTAHLWGAAQAAREATDIALPPGERMLHEPYLIAARSQLGESAWEAALAEGRTMSLEEAAEYALSKEKTDPPATPVPVDLPTSQPLSKLTRREQEVAGLVASELTNRQIAMELMLSEHTVATHVRNVLKKLGLYSRNQIADWFAEHQPLP